jgi:T5SS/PEP-CTERM-associated repeat protein
MRKDPTETILPIECSLGLMSTSAQGYAMKTIPLSGFAAGFVRIVLSLVFICSPLALRAQLVADGQTAVLDGVGTNIADTVTVGTNGSFTMLVLTNGAAVTNSGAVNLGLNSSAGHNLLVLAGGSTWNNTSSSLALNIGNSGSFNELDIVGGSTMMNSYSYLGYNSPSSNNTVQVSDPGSLWQPSNIYLGQSGGANNLLIITNGARVMSGIAVIGSGGGRSNTAIVTGTGSSWTNNNGLAVGAYGSNSLFIVTNGAAVFSGTLSGVGMQGSASVGNLAVVTDAGSRWTVAGTFYAGNFSSRNELDILNGGVVASATGIVGGNFGVSNNVAVVAGAGSVWTNGTLTVGNNGSRNSLIITNGGKVYCPNGSSISGSASASNNAVLISGNGSMLNSGYFYLGYISPGGNRLTINNGGAFLSGNVFDVGVYCNSNLFTLADAGSLLQCATLRASYMGTGNQCVVSNGATLNVQGTSTIQGTAMRMTITGAGTLWTNGGDVMFGQVSNVLAIASGGTVADNNGYLVYNPGNVSNLVVVAGANSLWKNAGDFHATDFKAQLLVTNGGTLWANNSYFGEGNHGGNDFAFVSGPGSLWTNQVDLYIGSNGPNNQIVANDFGTVQARTLFVGYIGNQNQLTVSNSGIVTVQSLTIGSPVNSLSNTVTISGGTITVSNSTSLIQYGTLAINSGTFITPFIGTDTSGPQASKIILNSGTFQSGATTYRNPAPFAVGDGTNAAVFEMLFEISPNQGTHTFRGGLAIANNGLVKGFGTIAANVSVNSGGTISPGTNNAITNLMVVGNLTLNPGSTTLMKLSALTGAKDSLTGMTNVTYGGTLQLNTITGSLAAGNSFKLFSATNYFGAFDQLVPLIPGPGLRWDTNTLNTDGILHVVAGSPPPPTLATLMTVDGNLVLNATGGVPFTPCYLLTCTNFPPTPADWIPVATNYFDGSGATSFTNAIPADEPQRYFKIQVN